MTTDLLVSPRWTHKVLDLTVFSFFTLNRKIWQISRLKQVKFTLSILLVPRELAKPELKVILLPRRRTLTRVWLLSVKSSTRWRMASPLTFPTEIPSSPDSCKSHWAETRRLHLSSLALHPSSMRKKLDRLLDSVNAPSKSRTRPRSTRSSQLQNSDICSSKQKKTSGKRIDTSRR